MEAIVDTLGDANQPPPLHETLHMPAVPQIGEVVGLGHRPLTVQRLT